MLIIPALLKLKIIRTYVLSIEHIIARGSGLSRKTDPTYQRKSLIGGPTDRGRVGSGYQQW
jgi:hypothetical protein